MSTAWNANPKPVGGFAPRALGHEHPVRSELRDQLAHEYEHRQPEGEATRGRPARLIAFTLGGMSLLGVVLMVYLLGYLAGWLAAAAGLAILAMFFVAGASGYVFGGMERARDAVHAQAEVVKDIDAIEHDRLTDTGATPKTAL